MKVIGITGGIGSGKSKVLSYMEAKFQAVICQTDHVAWFLQEPGKSCYKQIVEVFGSEILNKDQTINRGTLGQIVFSDESKLQKLNHIMHPEVKDYVKDWIAKEQKRDKKYFVIESALLLEDNYQEFCDEIWYIHADMDVRRKRLKESRPLSDEKMDAIISTQLTEQEFREICSIVIDNSGDFQNTCEQIEKLIK